MDNGFTPREFDLYGRLSEELPVGAAAILGKRRPMAANRAGST